MTDASSAQRVYVNIADQLRSDIVGGIYEDGERLPGEDELAARFQVASRTINRAIDLLKADGHAVGRRGSGVYVQRPLTIRHEPFRAPDAPGWKVGSRGAVEIRALDIDQVAVISDRPPAAIASALGLDTEQPTVIWTARYSAPRRPVKLTRTYVPAALVAENSTAGEDPTPRRLTTLLSDLGLWPEHGFVETRGRAPGSEDCELLEIPVGRPVLDCRLTVWDAQGRALAVEQTVMDTAAYVVAHAVDLHGVR
ncbi:GntR family transcriptional regulator [Streptomyces sp. NPDC058371]|uniref:GntR family transcriptional regulator n=1 Tax=Streptomyces sp. NPDC058371 TaxID=3346463 RepID=UPI0036498ACB